MAMFACACTSTDQCVDSVRLEWSVETTSIDDEWIAWIAWIAVWVIHRCRCRCSCHAPVDCRLIVVGGRCTAGYATAQMTELKWLSLFPFLHAHAHIGRSSRFLTLNLSKVEFYWSDASVSKDKLSHPCTPENGGWPTMHMTSQLMC